MHPTALQFWIFVDQVLLPRFRSFIFRAVGAQKIAGGRLSKTTVRNNVRLTRFRAYEILQQFWSFSTKFSLSGFQIFVDRTLGAGQIDIDYCWWEARQKLPFVSRCDGRKLAMNVILWQFWSFSTEIWLSGFQIFFVRPFSAREGKVEVLFVARRGDKVSICEMARSALSCGARNFTAILKFFDQVLLFYIPKFLRSRLRSTRFMSCFVGVARQKWVLVTACVCRSLTVWIVENIAKSSPFDNILLVGHSCSEIGSFLPHASSVLALQERRRKNGRS